MLPKEEHSAHHRQDDRAMCLKSYKRLWSVMKMPTKWSENVKIPNLTKLQWTPSKTNMKAPWKNTHHKPA